MFLIQPQGSFVFSCREEIPKQEGFVGSLINYTHAQWMEFFQMSPGTAQCLVDTIGPLFRQRSGVYVVVKNWLSVDVHTDSMTDP